MHQLMAATKGRCCCIVSITQSISNTVIDREGRKSGSTSLPQYLSHLPSQTVTGVGKSPCSSSAMAISSNNCSPAFLQGRMGKAFIWSWGKGAAAANVDCLCLRTLRWCGGTAVTQGVSSIIQACGFHWSLGRERGGEAIGSISSLPIKKPSGLCAVLGGGGGGGKGA